ncbi:AraC family transcriptional regulator [Streptomyces olivaceoviridis]|uniref:AraC family transcriptional regulator n=1 Tax=Streptomyces olivaceoviridis TaxID=1921 RepID=UPI003F4C533F
MAHRWGFTSPSHFSRVFRATYGVSPAEWRNSMVLAAPLPRRPASTSLRPDGDRNRLPEPGIADESYQDHQQVRGPH